MDNSPESTEDPNSEVIFFPISLELKRWPENQSAIGQELISQHYLSDIENCYIEAEILFSSMTTELLPYIGSYISAVTFACFFYKNDDLNHIEYVKVEKNLSSAVGILKVKWIDVLADAKKRLGDKFDESLYPDSCELEKLFEINIEVPIEDEKENDVSLRKLLGHFHPDCWT